MGQERLEIDTKFAVGWLSKIADSEASRENKIYPEGVGVRGLLTTLLPSRLLRWEQSTEGPPQDRLEEVPWSCKAPIDFPPCAPRTLR